MKEIPLTGPKFESQTPESFHAYVKSLMHSTASKEVQGIRISIGKNNKLTIRITKDQKTVTREELTLLAKEYEQDEQELLTIFRKRKIEVIYADSDTRRETEIPVKTKKNARTKKTRGLRETGSLNQLLQPEHHSRLPEESSVLAIEELKE